MCLPKKIQRTMLSQVSIVFNTWIFHYSRHALCEFQVGDLNLWNLHNPKQERFFSGKTRQIHRTHLTTYDRLWSNIPWVNPMATITQDTLADYGFDEENCNVHDVIGIAL